MFNFFKKKDRPVNETGVHIASLNWFIHVLINNIGYSKWVRMTKKEQELHDKEVPYNAGYPYKVIRYPILSGRDIILKDERTIKIKCDSEKTRNLIIEMAREYSKLEKHYIYNLQLKRAEKWIKVEDLPEHSPVSSAPDYLRGLIYYNGCIIMGFRRKNKWYTEDNKKKNIKVTHFRYLPPKPLD